MYRLPIEVRLMIFKEARRTAFKKKIDRFNMLYSTMLDEMWFNHRLWTYRMAHDRRSAAEELQEQLFWN